MLGTQVLTRGFERTRMRLATAGADIAVYRALQKKATAGKNPEVEKLNKQLALMEARRISSGRKAGTEDKAVAPSNLSYFQARQWMTEKGIR